MIVPAYTKQLWSDLPYRSIATLADEPAGLTCSVIVGEKWASGGSRALQLRGYSTYEQAAQTVLDGENDVLLVAGAYPSIRLFFFHQRLQAKATFLATLPDMVLCASKHPRASSFTRLYYHPATEGLALEVATVYKHKKSVTSNSRAARLVAESNGTSAAITNRASAEYYNLQIIQTLAAGTLMSFVVFAKK